MWTIGSEEDLVDGLERGGLDLAIGGMTERTPWSERVSVTRGYRGYRGVPSGHGEPVVILLPLGENRLQSALEQYLDEQVPGLRARGVPTCRLSRHERCAAPSDGNG